MDRHASTVALANKTTRRPLRSLPISDLYLPTFPDRLKNNIRGSAEEDWCRAEAELGF